MIYYIRKLFSFIKLIWGLTFLQLVSINKRYYYYSYLGKIYFDLEKYEKAILFFKKSEDFQKKQDLEFSGLNFHYLGHCYLTLGDFQNAVWYLEDSLKLFPDDYSTMAFIGWCYEMLDEPEWALKSYEQAIKLDPIPISLYYLGAMILSNLDRKKEALEYIELAKESAKDKDEWIMKHLDGTSHIISGNYKDAIEFLKETISSYIEKADNIFIEKIDIYGVLAHCQRESGDSKGALSTLEEAYKECPDLSLGNELAMEYANQNTNFERALEIIERALKYQPYHPLFMDTRGWIFFKMGRLDEAKQEIERSLKLKPKNKGIQEHYFTVLKEHKNLS